MPTGGQKKLSVVYRPSFASPPGQSFAVGGKDERRPVEEVTHALSAGLERGGSVDIQYGITTVGSRRDDVELSLDGEPVRSFASQGEQRSCALAMTTALAAAVRAMSHQAPLLLLDDVLSELDERDRRGVFGACGAQQMIVTRWDQHCVPGEVRSDSTVFGVKEGSLR